MDDGIVKLRDLLAKVLGVCSGLYRHDVVKHVLMLS